MSRILLHRLHKACQAALIADGKVQPDIIKGIPGNTGLSDQARGEEAVIAAEWNDVSMAVIDE